MTDNAPEPFQTFSVHPELLEKGKTSTRLVRTQHINSGVQVVADGGETNLHAHTSQDEIWYVVGGEAAFYTTDDKLVAKLQVNDGILVPAGAPYWFESTSKDNLVILRFGAHVPTDGPDKRIDYGDRRFSVSGLPGEKRENVLAGKRFGE